MAQFDATRRTLPGLDMHFVGGESRLVSQDTGCTGVAWLSSARVVRCWVKSRNERNPCDLLPPEQSEHSNQTAQINWEEGGDDVKSVWPLRPGLHTYYNAQHNMNRYREVEEIEKTELSSD